MNPLILVGIFVLTLLVIAILLIFRLIKKRKKEKMLKESIPQEVLDDFNYAEQKLKGGINEDGTVNKDSDPYSILWEITKRNRTRERARELEVTESRDTPRQLHPESVRRESIQIATTPSVNQDSNGTRGSKQNRNRNFFSRIRRRPTSN